MKKALSCLLAVLIITSMLTACSNEDKNKPGTEKLSIVAATFPAYDWLRQILGEKTDMVELELLLDNGVDLHSYQPSVADIAAISACDMFVHVGGESDAWLHDALRAASNEEMIIVNLMSVLDGQVKEEEIIEGMEHEHEHENEHEHEHEHEQTDGHERELDEHVWLSLKNVKIACAYISEELGKLEAQNAEIYAANAGAYIEKLSALDAEYQNVVDSSAVKTLLFGDRFPFRYLVDDYRLEYYAAFPGCSAETEASFETIVFLANKIDELGLENVMVLETSDQSIARTIIDNTADKNQSILTLDSMQSVTEKDMSSEVNYLSIMESNLEVLKKALG